MTTSRRAFLVTTASLPLVSILSDCDVSADKRGLVSLTFDDGWASQYTNALPILQDTNIKATFYIISDAARDSWGDYMNAKQVLHINDLGHEIGSHTATHPDLTAISSTEAAVEIERSKKDLESLLGSKKVRTFTYPYDHYNDKIIELVKRAGYESAHEGDDLQGRQPVEFNTSLTDRYLLQSAVPTKNTSFEDLRYQIDRAQQAGLWLIIVFHRIDNSGDKYSSTTVYLEKVISYITNKNIATATVSDALISVI